MRLVFVDVVASATNRASTRCRRTISATHFALSTFSFLFFLPARRADFCVACVACVPCVPCDAPMEGLPTFAAATSCCSSRCKNKGLEPFLRSLFRTIFSACSSDLRSPSFAYCARSLLSSRGLVKKYTIITQAGNAPCRVGVILLLLRRFEQFPYCSPCWSRRMAPCARGLTSHRRARVQHRCIGDATACCVTVMASSPRIGYRIARIAALAAPCTHTKLGRVRPWRFAAVLVTRSDTMFFSEKNMRSSRERASGLKCTRLISADAIGGAGDAARRGAGGRRRQEARRHAY